MKIVFLDTGWEDYLFWQSNDKAMLKKVNALIKEIMRTPFEGTGKPEALRFNLTGWWSRRLNLEHHLIYKIENNSVIILQCKFHY